MEIQKPIAKLKAAQIDCAIWENEVSVNGKTQTILKATVSRRYRDRNGNWKSAQSFSWNEIPLVIHVLQKAFEMMLAAPKEQSDAESPEEPTEEVIA